MSSCSSAEAEESQVIWLSGDPDVNSRAMIISNTAETIPARHETEYRFIKAAMNIILLS
jgi:hypothetical protein